MKTTATHINSLQSKEELPQKFTVQFTEFANETVRVSINDVQVGDVINDNSVEKDFYRYHDVFHYTFATFLGWSPCTRSMLKLKRKSKPLIDEMEDGARATITEEAISLLLFNEAKRNDYFQKANIKPAILQIIMQMTETFEVKNKTKEDWEEAILKGYELFILLKKNRGGSIHFDATKKTAQFVA